jgi:hypothetical protein
MASSTPTAALDTGLSVYGSNPSWFDGAVSGVKDALDLPKEMNSYEASKMATKFAASQMDGGGAPQAPDMGGMMQQLAAGGQQRDPSNRVNWVTPISGQDSIINALLARGRQ